MAQRNSVPHPAASDAKSGEASAESSAIKKESGTVVDESLSPVQRLAIEALTRGRSIKSTAEEVGTGRRTLTRWLSDDPAFRAAYASWKAEVRESARGRLLGMVDAAVKTLNTSIRKGDVASARDLLKHLAILSPIEKDTTGAEEIRLCARLEKLRREADRLEMENSAYWKRYRAAKDRPSSLKEEDEQHGLAAGHDSDPADTSGEQNEQ